MKAKAQVLSKIICILLAVLMCTACLSGCSNPLKDPDQPTEPITLIVAGAWEDCKAMEAVGREFNKYYPNITIQYEYLQDFNASLPKRMTGESAVDLFLTNGIQAGSPFLEYALDLYSIEGLDLSDTFRGLIENFEYYGETENDETKLYAIPLGAELRGLYVNKTLLDSLNIEIPTDQASLLAACEKLVQNGYIPFHGNPGRFAQTLLYPWICNIVANADDPQAAYDKVNNREEGLSEMFAEPFEFLYNMVEKGYYDYKRAQSELNLYLDDTDVAYARDFFNVVEKDGTFAKKDDVGLVAFMPSPMALQETMDRVKEDYHSEIEYVFMTAPVGVDGGYAYMSPARGIAINNASENQKWCIKFLNFLFMPKFNELFAQEFGIIPNSKDSFDYINDLFDLPDDHISHLGQVTFDYEFYNIITKTLLNMSKCNNPKYMVENADGSLSLPPLSSFTDDFDAQIAAVGD